MYNYQTLFFRVWLVSLSTSGSHTHSEVFLWTDSVVNVEQSFCCVV